MTLTNRGGMKPAASFVPAMPLVEEPALLRAARRALPPAQQILSAAGRPMLTIAAELNNRRPRIAIRCWSDTFEVHPWRPPSHSDDLQRAYRAVGRAGMNLARQLARRWPANAVPHTMGVITDGIGLAVSGEHPSALTSAWLHDQVAGRARLCIVLPFGKWTQWAVLPAGDAPVLQ